MNQVITSEWFKLRSLRSTYFVLGGAVAAALFGCAVSLAMTLAWDVSAPATKAAMSNADPVPVVFPFLEFCVATLAILTITGEYGTGMIRTSLTAAPARGRVLAAKAAVVAAVTLVVGEVLAAGMYLAYRLIVGDRGAPIGTSDAVLDGLGPALADGVALAVVCLVALGLGTAIRSTAGTIVVLTVLLFVLPAFTPLLPASLVDWYNSLLLINLGGELGGIVPEATLSPLGAAGVLAAYAALALGAGAAVLRRRDA